MGGGLLGLSESQFKKLLLRMSNEKAPAPTDHTAMADPELEDLMEEAPGYHEKALSENTRQAYRRGWEDLVEWVSAAEPTDLPWIQGLFLKCHEENRLAAVESSINNDPLARGIRDYLETQTGDEWTGTATALKEKLDRIVPGPEQSSDKYPTSANWLSRRLNRVKKMLRQVGIGISRNRNHGGRRIRVYKLDL